MDWRIAAITFNVNMKSPTNEAVHEMLKPTIAQQPHVLIVGMQEVMHLETLGRSAVTWHKSILEWIRAHNGSLVLLAKTFQATNQVWVFFKKQLLSSVNEVSYRYIRNTMGGVTGHKGSIGVRIEFKNESSIVVVCSHFVHDVFQLEKRIQQFNSNRVCSFPERRFVKAVIWLGDLNFRVEKDAEECHSLLMNNRDAEVLAQSEQLIRQMREQQIFEGFKEQPITFKPTYRLDVGTTNFDLKRTPSWCDRILYKGEGLTAVSYGSLRTVLTSDHLPVMATFNLRGEKMLSGWDVIFEQLPTWYTTVPLICRFRLLNYFWNRHGSYFDWVGLFPENIEDGTTVAKWVWVATCYNQTVDRQKYIVCEFSNVAEGRYRLGYFSYYRNCLIGLSKTVVVTPQPE